MAAGGADLATTLLDECAAIAARQGFPPRVSSTQRNRAIFATAGSRHTASMLREIERSALIAADHVIGDLLGRSGEDTSRLLRIAYAHLKTYEARRRARQQNFASTKQGPKSSGDRNLRKRREFMMEKLSLSWWTAAPSF